MDAAEIAYDTDPLKNAVTKLSMWVVGGGVEFGPGDVELVLDSLELARKERDEWIDDANLGRQREAEARRERDAAQKDAKDARALLAEAAGWVFPHDGPLRVSIAATLEQKSVDIKDQTPHISKP